MLGTSLCEKRARLGERGECARYRNGDLAEETRRFRARLRVLGVFVNFRT
jgi:hypothetical protein